MKNAPRHPRRGQATVEYILLLALVAALALILFKVLGPALGRMSANLEKVIEERLSKGLYHVKVGK